MTLRKDYEGLVEDIKKIDKRVGYLEHESYRHTEARENMTDIRMRQLQKEFWHLAEKLDKLDRRVFDIEIREEQEYPKDIKNVKEIFQDVYVRLCDDGTLYINRKDTDEQVKVFKVVEDKK